MDSLYAVEHKKGTTASRQPDNLINKEPDIICKGDIYIVTPPRQLQVGH